MEPVAPESITGTTLVDFLDRLLEKGLVIRADLIISLAGIPLLGVSLSAAIAGIETMLQYGIMTDWDASIRACEGEQRATVVCWPLLEGEELLLKMFGFHYQSDGVYRAWRPGTIYLTKERLLFFNRIFREATVEVPLGTITSLSLASVTNLDGKKRKVLVVLADSKEWIRLRGQDIAALYRSVTERLAEMGKEVEESAVLMAASDPALSFPGASEEIAQSGKTWFRVEGRDETRPSTFDGLFDESNGPRVQ